MSDSREVIEALLKLQEAQTRANLAPGQDNAATKKLRKLVPPQIQGHYDRLTARGKKGVAVVRNSTCTGCFMKVALSSLQILRNKRDIRLCDTCGRYLYLPEDEGIGTEAEKERIKKETAEKKKAKKAAAAKKKSAS